MGKEVVINITPETVANYDLARVLAITTATAARVKGTKEYALVPETEVFFGPMITDESASVTVCTGIMCLLDAFASETDDEANNALINDLATLVQNLTVVNEDGRSKIVAPPVVTPNGDTVELRMDKEVLADEEDQPDTPTT